MRWSPPVASPSATVFPPNRAHRHGAEHKPEPNTWCKDPGDSLAAGEGGDEGDGHGDGDGADGKPGGRRRKAANADPSSTLAATWDELNAKKFDLAFAVDPLFHKTSAQFDEGGAKGALLLAAHPPGQAGSLSQLINQYAIHWSRMSNPSAGSCFMRALQLYTRM